MKTKLLVDGGDYDGSQLQSLFAYKTAGVMGDSIVSWVGPCNVKNEFMKDGEDLFQGETIYSTSMLHFIIEHFETNLRTMVALQRLFSSIIKDDLQKSCTDLIERRGDDLYIGTKKLNVSIATIGPVSGMIHCGINVSSEGTPVETIGLKDLNIDVEPFAERLMQSYADEFESIKQACQKVFSI